MNLRLVGSNQNKKGDSPIIEAMLQGGYGDQFSSPRFWAKQGGVKYPPLNTNIFPKENHPATINFQGRLLLLSGRVCCNLGARLLVAAIHCLLGFSEDVSV